MIRDLTKSMISFSWAMSLFGLKQATNLFTPQDPGQPTHRTTAAFNSVTQATEEQLGDVLRGAFRAGDQLQKGMVDIMFSFLTLQAFNPNWMMRTTADTMRETTEAFGQGAQGGTSGSRQQRTGWGPVPPPGADRA